MSTIIIGSARIGENGKIIGGKAGDQKQTSSTSDRCGEVSMQSFYVHSKGWYILRPKKISDANSMASLCEDACNNPNLGYNQNERLGVVKCGIHTKTATNCDCGTLVREIVKEATGKDPGNFTTANAASTLEATGLFEAKKAYVSQSKTPVYNGDILVTKTKGHIVTVVSGSVRKDTSSKPAPAPIAPKTHTVALGDTVGKIAKCYGTTISKIVQNNKKKYPKLTADHIEVGWILTL